MVHVGFLWDKSKSFFFFLPHCGYELYSRTVECKSGTTTRSLKWSIYRHKHAHNTLCSACWELGLYAGTEREILFSVDKKNQLDVTFCILYFSSNSC